MFYFFFESKVEKVSLYLQSQWMDLKILNGVWKLKRFCITGVELTFNPIAYGILRLSQLRGWDFYPTPQKTMLKSSIDLKFVTHN